MEGKLIYNAIQTPDGTILESTHRHDFKQYEDANGWVYMVDGGLDYARRSVNKNAPATELSLYADDPHVVVREVPIWGTYGKSGEEPLKQLPLADMSSNHLKACLTTQPQMKTHIRRLMVHELDYRDESYEQNYSEGANWS